MSTCNIANRNEMSSIAHQCLKNNAIKIRKILRGWIAALINSQWMIKSSVAKEIRFGGIKYPLALIQVNHKGKN